MGGWRSGSQAPCSPPEVPGRFSGRGAEGLPVPAPTPIQRNALATTSVLGEDAEATLNKDAQVVPS